jgi:hypothetical protein
MIHTIVLLRDPEKIVIQGIYADAGLYFIKTLRDKVNTMPFYKMPRNLPIVYTLAPNDKVTLIGVGCCAIEKYLDTNSLYD